MNVGNCTVVEREKACAYTKEVFCDVLTTNYVDGGLKVGEHDVIFLTAIY